MLKSRAFRSHIICHDQIGALVRKLAARVFGDMVSFGGESGQNAVTFYFGNSGKYVDSGLKLHMQVAGRALDLLFLRRSGSVIGNGGGHHDNGSR